MPGAARKSWQVVDRDLGWSRFLRRLPRTSQLRLEVGIFDAPEIVVYAVANEYGVDSKNIPERGAWRASWDANRQRYEGMLEQGLAAYVLGRASSWKEVLEGVGAEIVADLRASIEQWSEPPNKRATLDNKARKGQGSSPLIASRTMVEAISYRVVPASGGTA